MEKNKQTFIRKNLPLIAILFVLGIIFLYLAEYDSNKENENSGIDFDEKVYTENLEQRLCAMLEKMDGVENATVMITLEGSSRYQITGENRSGLQNSIYTSSFLQEDTASSQNPILIEIEAPKIKGVSVVCRGAENIQIRQRIINLISSTLNLPKNKIYVTE